MISLLRRLGVFTSSLDPSLLGEPVSLAEEVARFFFPKSDGFTASSSDEELTVFTEEDELRRNIRKGGFRLLVLRFEVSLTMVASNTKDAFEVDFLPDCGVIGSVLLSPFPRLAYRPKILEPIGISDSVWDESELSSSF